MFNSQIPQQGEINENTGGFTQTYPIAVPPGRNSLQPDLKLIYTTAASEPNSIFGANWSISIPYIAREARYGSDKLYSTTTSPFFYSSIDGELATTTVTSVYAARVDNGAFRSYTSSSNQWLVKDKNGTQYKYGYSAATRQDDPNNSANVYSKRPRESAGLTKNPLLSAPREPADAAMVAVQVQTVETLHFESDMAVEQFRDGRHPTNFMRMPGFPLVGLRSKTSLEEIR